MTTDVLPRLLAWLSPAFPTGAFAYSHGLEWAIEAGDIRDAATLAAWLGDVLAHGSGRTDAMLLRLAHRAHDDIETLRDLAATAAALAPARERRDETLNQGRAFVLAAAVWGAPPTPDDPAYPIALGAQCGAHGIAENAAAAGFLQAFASNLISAAVRAIPLGQTDGLRVLAGLERTILDIAAATETATADDLGGCAFRSDIAAMRHETQYTRLFRS